MSQILLLLLQVSVALVLLTWLLIRARIVFRKRDILDHLGKAWRFEKTAQEYEAKGMYKNADACMRSCKEEAAKAAFLKALNRRLENFPWYLWEELKMWWFSYRIDLTRRDMQHSRIWIWLGRSSISFDRIWRFKIHRLKTITCVRFGPLCVTMDTQI